MSHYDNLDQLIVAAISANHSPFDAREVKDEARLLAEVLNRDAYRVIDGRLSALKKAGRIVHRSKKEAKAGSAPAGWATVAARGRALG